LNTAATVGELWFYFYDNINVEPPGSGTVSWGVGQAISIKWLALKISGRTIKTPFRSGSVKQWWEGEE